jgi:hypothetical protein
MLDYVKKILKRRQYSVGDCEAKRCHNCSVSRPMLEPDTYKIQITSATSGAIFVACFLVKIHCHKKKSTFL